MDVARAVTNEAGLDGRGGPPAEGAAPASEPKAAKGGRKQVLIVDDAPTSLAILEHLLAPQGLELTRASDGAEALRLAGERSFDLVLLDRRMPGLDGIEVLRRLRALPNRPWVPVILVTADDEREARLEGLEAGADEFLTRPVDPPLLIARVRTLLALREAQDELAERARRLEEANRGRRELVGFIVHDLKNPLAIIRANLGLVRQQVAGLPSDALESIFDSEDAARRMSGLVGDILSVERAEEVGLELDEEPLDLGRLVVEVAQADDRLARAHQVTVSVSTREAAVVGDPKLLRRALENLLDNAVRHTPRGGAVELRVEVDSEAHLRVSNTGRAIAPELRGELFSKFVRGGADAGRSGLGLYFCRQVAEAHGGRIELEERDGWPTSFRLSLPRAG